MLYICPKMNDFSQKFFFNFLIFALPFIFALKSAIFRGGSLACNGQKIGTRGSPLIYFSRLVV